MEECEMLYRALFAQGRFVDSGLTARPDHSSHLEYSDCRSIGSPLTSSYTGPVSISLLFWAKVSA